LRYARSQFRGFGIRASPHTCILIPVSWIRTPKIKQRFVSLKT
jgi:hypothetical protein